MIGSPFFFYDYHQRQQQCTQLSVIDRQTHPSAAASLNLLRNAMILHPVSPKNRLRVNLIKQLVSAGLTDMVEHIRSKTCSLDTADVSRCTTDHRRFSPDRYFPKSTKHSSNNPFLKKEQSGCFSNYRNNYRSISNLPF